jgi:plasmid stability protein
MADVKIRRLEDDVVAFHKDRAARAGRSLEEELRGVLRAAARQPNRELAASVRAHQKRLRRRYGTLPDSTPGIRAERDRRG